MSFRYSFTLFGEVFTRHIQYRRASAEAEKLGIRRAEVAQRLAEMEHQQAEALQHWEEISRREERMLTKVATLHAQAESSWERGSSTALKVELPVSRPTRGYIYLAFCQLGFYSLRPPFVPLFSFQWI